MQQPDSIWNSLAEFRPEAEHHLFNLPCGKRWESPLWAQRSSSQMGLGWEAPLHPTLSETSCLWLGQGGILRVRDVERIS